MSAKGALQAGNIKISATILLSYIDLCCNSAEPFRSLLQVGAQVKAIETPCPTWFATMHLVLKSVVGSKEAFKSAVISDEWDSASSGSEKASAFHNSVVGRSSDVWKDADIALKLVQPVCDAIHQIEGDRPLLGALPSLYKKLLQHAHNFTVKYAGTKYVRDEIVQIFKDRFA
jgi:hypothetical protein